MTRAATVLARLREAEEAYNLDKNQLDAKHAPILHPLRSELSDMERDAIEIVRACGRDVVEARASWNAIHFSPQKRGCTAAGYTELGDAEIGAETVIVRTRNYCGEGEWDDGAPITFPSRWLDSDVTHETRCAELRAWYVEKAARIERKKKAAQDRAAAEREAEERATFERLRAKFSTP